MWQAPNQRAGAQQSPKKRQNERLKRPIHLQRVCAAVRLIPRQETHAQANTQGPQGETIQARVLLNDLSSTGIGIYTQTMLSVGQEIQIVLENPMKMEISGNVIWCQEQSNGSAIVSSQPFRYRAGVKFAFATPQEEEALKKFCQDLQQNHLYRVK